MAESPELFDDESPDLADDDVDFDDVDLGYDKKAYFSPDVPLQLVTRHPKGKGPLREQKSNEVTPKVTKTRKVVEKENPRMDSESDSDRPSKVPLKRGKEPLCRDRNSEITPKRPKTAKDVENENPRMAREGNSHHTSTAPQRGNPLQEHGNSEVMPKRTKTAKGAEEENPRMAREGNSWRTSMAPRHQNPVQEHGNSEVTPKRTKTAKDVEEENSSGVENALLKTNKLLATLVKKMDGYDERIKEVERKVNGSPSGSSRKRIVPLEVRRETRRVYAMLLEEDDSGFDGWTISPGVTFKSKENQEVVTRLVQEVRGLNGNFMAQHIRDAAYRFYRTKCEEDAIKRNGQIEAKKRSKRKHERRVRKLTERKLALEKMKFKHEKARKQWMSAMKMQLMSSEDSETDDGEELIVVHPLPWRSPHLERMLENLDSNTVGDKSPQGRRLMKRRVIGTSSSRAKPDSDDLPRWVFA